ncbi:MAG TPA: GNAT family N-acetyltransferase [Myxococcota bacterium]|nr:GNAT family N-acetyltransferase [Myxococcota bacterium]
MEPIELRTERLWLRQWRPSDGAPFAALCADPRVMEFFPATLSRAEAEALAERCRAGIARRGWGLWAVEAPGVTPFAGFVGLDEPGPHVPVAPCVEIGWRLAAEHWGRGYASEAAHAVLQAGFARLGLHEIVSFTAVGNRRSRAVMERIGLHFAGETFEHPSVPEGSPLRTHVVYRLARSTPARKSSTASNAAG